MAKPKIVVTGATGKTGGALAAQLLQAGYPVRAWVHRLDGRSARLLALDAEVVVVDLADAEHLAGALHGAQRAYYCPPYGPHMLQSAVAFAAAAQQARLEHVAVLTQWLASPSHPALMTEQHWLADRVFSMMSGVGHSFIRPGFFADTYLLTLGLAANLGLMPWLFGEHRDAPPSNEDIARVAAAVLMDPAPHAGMSYRPTGPRLLGKQDIAAAIGSAVGRKVRAVPTSTRMFMKSARLAGFPIGILSNLRYYIEDHRRGAFEHGAPTSHVLEVTGRPAEEFEAVARRYAGRPEHRRTPGNRLRTLAQFLAAPLAPGFDFERYERGLGRPFPSAPQFAPDSSLWRQERAAAGTSPRRKASLGAEP